jgi:hypothetical protein
VCLFKDGMACAYTTDVVMRNGHAMGVGRSAVHEARIGVVTIRRRMSVQELMSTDRRLAALLTDAGQRPCVVIWLHPWRQWQAIGVGKPGRPIEPHRVTLVLRRLPCLRVRAGAERDEQGSKPHTTRRAGVDQGELTVG